MSYPATWTPIAYRPHGADKAIWYPVEGALMSVDSARKLDAAGEIWAMQRREQDRTAIVIRGREQKAKKR